MRTQPVSPNSLKRSSLSPTFEELSYLDAEPYIQDAYSMSSSQRQTPQAPPLTAGTDQTEDPFQQMGPPSFVPSSSISSEGTWDDYIAWDSLKSPMDFHLSLPTHAAQDQSTAPPFDEAYETWTLSQEPQPFSSTFPHTKRSDSDLFAPSQTSSASQDAMGDYLLTSGSSYPSLLAEPVLDPSQLTPMSAELQDSGFVSRSASHTGRHSLDKIQTKTSSGTGSSHESDTKSPLKRRTSSTLFTQSQGVDSKKSRKNKPTSHNDVEKRYRSKLNTMIVELSNSVPALRSATGSENASGDEMEVEMGTKSGYPSKGLKKATILGKATEYIKSLEGEVKSLGEENRVLKRRLGLVGRIAGEEGLK